MTRSGRSLLRQASVLFVLFCFGAAFAAPALAQDGPDPEPAPPRTQEPKPEPVPGAKPQPSQPASTRVSPPPASPPPAPPPAPAPPAPAPSPLLVSPPAAVQVHPAAPSPAAPKRQEGTQTRKREKPKTKPFGRRTTKQTARKALPTLVREQASSPDTMLMVGGLALFVLVLADTVFLTLSTRYLRPG